jgi:hypothetical protein
MHCLCWGAWPVRPTTASRVEKGQSPAELTTSKLPSLGFLLNRTVGSTATGRPRLRLGQPDGNPSRIADHAVPATGRLVEKTLFRLPGRLRISTVPIRRLVMAEAPIDAMSVATIEHLRADTLYVATAGGMGPGTIAALERQLRALATEDGAELAIATDNDKPGHCYAARLTEMAAALDLRATRLLPDAKDWNDVLRRGRGA